MRFFFRCLIVGYFIFRMADCAESERRKARFAEPETKHKSREVSGADPEKTFSNPRSYTIKRNIPEEDSLERMYDRNNMDFDLYHNPDEDDEWHDYYND